MNSSRIWKVNYSGNTTVKSVNYIYIFFDVKLANLSIPGLARGDDVHPAADERVGAVGRIPAILPMAAAGVIRNIRAVFGTFLVRFLASCLILIITLV